LICVVALAASMPGCGAGATRSAGQHPGKADGQQGTAQIPQADRSAFYGIATVSGTLRRIVAPVALGQAVGPADRDQLLNARRQLAALRPRDRQLAHLKVKLIAALTAVLRPAHGSGAVRRASRRALHSTDVINSGLHGYAASHPGTAALIPD
jgi:hypothetical protein